MTTRPRYAELVRKKMKERGASIRSIADQIGYSYEHIRKVLSGEPVVSGDLNEALAKHLGLDAGVMWTIARAEKARRQFGDVRGLHELLPSRRLKDVWPYLTLDQRDLLETLAEELATKPKE